MIGKHKLNVEMLLVSNTPTASISWLAYAVGMFKITRFYFKITHVQTLNGGREHRYGHKHSKAYPKTSLMEN